MDEAIKKQTAALLKGGLKASQGTLTLYPDRLVHVGSVAAAAGMGFGAVGALVGQALARNKANKAQEGDKGVTTIHLADVSALRKAKQGLNKNLLEVETSGGEAYRFGANYGKWKDDLTTALQSAGRQVSDEGDSITVR